MKAALPVSRMDWLESEAIEVLREAAAEATRPAMLFSAGKRSIAMLRIAEKAFRPGRFPFPLLHIDTEHGFPEVIAFRDARAAELGERLVVRSVGDSIRAGRVTLRRPDEPREPHQAVTLLDAVAELGFDALLGAEARDEAQALGEPLRVFPLSHWSELDTWHYIARERLAVPSIYYAHERDVVLRRGLLAAVTALAPARAGEVVVTRRVRFRTVGDVGSTSPVASGADTPEKVIAGIPRHIVAAGVATAARGARAHG